MNRMQKDALTGLLNRQGLNEWYENFKTEYSLQFMFLDLDNFKGVNDTYGHNVGDEVLIAVAAILTDCVSGDICARIGGDEFIIAMKGDASRQLLSDIATNIIQRIQKKEGFPDISTNVSASIGILQEASRTQSLTEILFQIDHAMYYAKNRGKAGHVFFNDIAETVYDAARMEQCQEEALKNGEFEVYYQPIIHAQSSKLFQSEAYLIWNMPDGTTRSQEEFFPLFEKNGFIRKLNLWVLETACTHISYVQEKYNVKGVVGVRISRLLLLNQELPELLAQILEKHGVTPQQLCLEVEETAFLRGAGEILLMLETLKTKGFRIAVVEVGTEFVSMKYWDRLVLDSIKFNVTYLQEALQSPRGRQIIKTLLLMGTDLKMKVIADGIGRKEDVMFLTGCGCNAISGSYYSKALPLLQYVEYVKSRPSMTWSIVMFPFLKEYRSKDGTYEGVGKGAGLELKKGISKKYGSIYFPGGKQMEHILELPSNILSNDSYSIGMWLKPEGEGGWYSALYARYLGGFLSFVPRLADGNSVFRISEDADVHGWHDVFARGLPKDKWSFVCITFDARSGSMRYYINGRKCGYLMDVPLLPNCRQIVLGGDPFQNSYQGYISALTFCEDVKSEEEIAAWYQEFLQEEEFAGEKETFWM